MTITTNAQGMWVISDLVGGYYVQRVYMGYSRRDAVQRFREEFYDTCNACGRDDSQHGYIEHADTCSNYATVSA